MALLILALLQRIFLMSSLMLLLVWLIFFMVLIKLLLILGTISGKTKSAADKGKYTRDYLAAAFPELNAWERAGADASSTGMVDAGFENQKELTKMQLD